MRASDYFIVGFVLSFVLAYVMLFVPSDTLMHIGLACISFFYIVLPVTYIVAYMLWRRGLRAVSTLLTVLANSLTLYGLALYLFSLAVLSEY